MHWTSLVNMFVKTKFSALIPLTVLEKEEIHRFLGCYDLHRPYRQLVFNSCSFSSTNRLKAASRASPRICGTCNMHKLTLCRWSCSVKIAWCYIWFSHTALLEVFYKRTFVYLVVFSQGFICVLLNAMEDWTTDTVTGL